MNKSKLLRDVRYGTPRSISVTYESGDIENWSFYSGSGCYLMAHDFRGLNDNGERYLEDEYEDLPVTLEEISDLIDGLLMAPDVEEIRDHWSNVDCDL